MTTTLFVPGTSRFNVHVNSMVPELADESFRAIVSASAPIAVERAMYTPGAADRGLPVWAAGTNVTAIKLP